MTSRWLRKKLDYYFQTKCKILPASKKQAKAATINTIFRSMISVTIVRSQKSSAGQKKNVYMSGVEPACVDVVLDYRMK